MNCKKARILCQELLDDKLNEKRRSALLTHLASCSACMSFYKENQKLKKLVASLPSPQLPSSFNSLVLMEITRRERQASYPFSSLRFAKKALLFLLPLFLLLFLLFDIYQGKLSEEKLFDTYKREHLVYTLQNPLIYSDSAVRILLVSDQQ